jgi:predicted nucleic acid-binding protein
VATADDTYVDPSALVCLYLHQSGRSREMAAWRAATDGALAVTHHGRTEITNAICLAGFRGDLEPAGLAEALADFEADFSEGRLVQADILWRSALNRATGLSRAHTPTLGTRALDVLHVACALELKLRRFLTFDDRQRKLAAAAGLKPIKL